MYILTNPAKTVLYIGVTSNLKKRMEQHLFGSGSKFTSQYNLKLLIYYEAFEKIESAILREKYLKGKTRRKKEALIALQNPKWNDLLSTLVF